MFKKNVKRILALVLSALMLVSFAACGKEKNIEDLSDEEIEEMLENAYNDDSELEVNNDTDNSGWNIFAKDIDLSQYFTVTYSGLNGNADAHLDVNYDALDALFTQEEMAKIFYEYYSSFEGNTFTEDSYYNYIDEWSLSTLLDFDLAENYANLSNGDVVIVKITSDADTISIGSIKKYFGINFDESFTVTVAGIQEGIPVDVLSDIEQYIVYEGANGKGYASLEIPESYSKEMNGFYISGDIWGLKIVYNNQQVVTFSPEIVSENNGQLKQGDVIKVSTQRYKDKLENYGAVFSPAEKEIIVPDLGNYATDASQLTQANIQEFQKAVYSEYSKYATSDDIYEHIGVYAGTLKPTEVSNTSSPFAVLCAVKESNPDFWNGGYLVYYHLCSINDIQIKPDGTITYDVAETVYETFSTLEELQAYVNGTCPYTCTKIG